MTAPELPQRFQRKDARIILVTPADHERFMAAKKALDSRSAHPVNQWDFANQLLELWDLLLPVRAAMETADQVPYTMAEILTNLIHDWETR